MITLEKLNKEKHNPNKKQQAPNAHHAEPANMLQRLVEKECLHLQDKLVEKTHNEYPFELSIYMQDMMYIASGLFEIPTSISSTSQLLSTFSSLISSWVALNDDQVTESGSIFNEFFEGKNDTIAHEQTRSSVKTWPTVKPSFYKVENVSSHSITVTDYFSNDTFTVSNIYEEKVTGGEMLLTFLLPAGQNYIFYDIPFQFDREDLDEILVHIDHFKLFYEQNTGDRSTSIQSLFNQEFPSIATVIFQFFTDRIYNNTYYTWTDPKANEVAKLIENYQVNYRDHQNYTIIEKNLFKLYYDVATPNISTPEAYAASVIYLANERLHFEDSSLTIEKVSEQLNTNAFEVSHLWKKVETTLGENLDELIEDYHGEIVRRTTVPKELNDDFGNLIQYGVDPLSINPSSEKEQFALEERLKNDNGKLIYSEELIWEPKTDEEVAVNTIFDVMDSSKEEKIKAIVEALKLDPTCIYAYTLAAEIAPTDRTSKACLEKALKLAEDLISQRSHNEYDDEISFFQKIIKPYLRAKVGLARIYSKEGDVTKALQLYKEVISYKDSENEYDPINAHYEYITLLINCGKYKEALRTIRTTSFRLTAPLLYNQALIEYLTNGNSRYLKTLLLKAIDENPYVYDELTLYDQLTNNHFTHVDVGKKNEAQYYAQSIGEKWISSPKLLKILKELHTQ
ncbi:hypothetical protein LGQ02_18125 [Bacillus shivajii]|uniref:tetratricopeptide repeat protein n=1 Tax=Bacillus shivajii TaxID=1983719 RepID=UPI001CFA850B|nr:hypothetical protein [Bacillus shivajii]UCZ52702.1 hypothetical protein LGQ02_18125 [Bacillus shivajii]